MQPKLRRRLRGWNRLHPGLRSGPARGRLRRVQAPQQEDAGR